MDPPYATPPYVEPASHWPPGLFQFIITLAALVGGALTIYGRPETMPTILPLLTAVVAWWFPSPHTPE